MKSFKGYLIESALNLALPPDVRSAIIDAGGKIYQVGGAVRDEMLGKVSKDLDLLVVGVELKDLAKTLTRFGKTNLVGKAFGIIKFKPKGSDEDIDISIPRIDSKSTGKGHKDFEVKLGKGITLQQDQLRRDFWMNAMARDIETGEIHDIGKKGQTDIDNQQIRVIGERAFKEDPLRMLRAIQFAARFDFTIEPDTMKQIKKNVNLIKTVSPERFQEEFKKLFEKGTPSIGVNLLQQTGILTKLFPRARSPFPIEYDKLDKKAFPAFLAVLLRGHKSKDIQKAMKLSNEDTNAVSDVLKYMAMRDVDSDLGLVKYVNSATPRGIQNMDYVLKAQKKVDIVYRLNSMRKLGKPTSLKELGVSGRDLAKAGFRGKTIGDALGYLLNYAIEYNNNDKKHLLDVAKSKYDKS
jgi:tRNA nucleotidyltransferase/poly(A) polymerase